ncbi:hypothetical protein PFFVO_02019 [Plasmodium falciparum Vietnam Oak-Knoll (FVO)]|uniref:Duffy-binding-like domain-containing protein n=2 Tax=Plasmodium falciparum TaxID=5833 RepID=A0A024V9W3_PLAFA|nr:hypothetical protein PFFVO_02019 [Plasmodium falciparum Vietnam Oak-Knoll (FVO)]
MGKGCTDCFFACNPYVEWIDNQRKQFDKQKERYNNVINGTSRSSRKTRAATTTKYDGYESKFYNKLKEGNYGTVGEFLGLLSKEKACKDITDGGTIHFEKVNTGGTAGSGGTSGTNDIKNGTFYRSKYCQPCPLCGVEREGNDWKEKHKIHECKSINLYKPIDKANPTPINFLYSGDRHEEINKKLEQFCTKTQNGGGGSGDCGGNSDSSLCEPWKCYHVNQLVKDQGGEDDPDYDQDVKEGGGLCILKNNINKKEKPERSSQMEPAEIQKTFNNFFNFWVAHMLKDSIYWRMKKLDKCINNTNGKQTKCKNGCNTKCECFKNWIEQKEKEWKPIKEHFKKQNIGEQTHCDPIVTLEGVLQIEFLNEDSTQDTENSLNAEEAEELKHLRKMLQETSGDGLTCSDSGTGKKKTLMDKLIEYEKKIAENCLQTHNDNECKPKPDGGPARILPAADGGGHDNVEEDEEDEDEEVEEPEEEEEKQEDATEGPATEKSVDVCDTVAKIFEDDKSLKEACSLKYGPGGKEKFPNWKCVSSGSDTGSTTSSEGGESGRRIAKRSAETSGPSSSSGATCIPPRRRRLYVGGLTKWATTAESKLDSTSATASHASNGDALLTAFVESAAVETFFLWDRYKKIKDKEDKEQQDLFGYVSSEPDELDDGLKNGEIPEEFLRQMFYTLGDYRDILFSGNNDNNIVLEASGTKEEKQKMKQIQQKIKQILESGDKASGLQEKNSVTNPRDTWWSKNAPDILKGMVCALTHKTEKPGDVDKQVETALMKKLDKDNGEYTYDKVTFKGGFDDDSKTSQAMALGAGPKAHLETTTKLKDFVKRPPFVRWLEEWADEFCRNQTHKLKIIEKECRGKNNGKYCDGDGYDCTMMVADKNKMFEDFNCPSCANACRSYKHWISRKKKEFYKQKEIYKKERESGKSKSRDIYDQQFVQRLSNGYDSVESFLNSLKSEPCKTNNGGNDITFGESGDTFKHAKNCDPCPVFGVKRQNGDWTHVRVKTCEDKQFTTNDIENKKDPNGKVDMLVIDNSAKKFPDDLSVCQNANIFKGIRKEQWKCDNVCDLDICDMESVNGGINDQKNIQIRALFTRWVEYFLKDYNKIKDKISHCINNEKKPICIDDCKKNCECVETWINLKNIEWENIKKRYQKHYKFDDTEMKSFVTGFLEKLQPESEVNKAIEPCDLTHFKKSCGLNGDKPSQKKDGKENDLVLCLIDRLEDKIKECKRNHAQNGGQSCTQTTPQTPHPEPDEEEEYENEDKNDRKVGHPQICDEVLKTQQQEAEPEGKCEEDDKNVDGEKDEKSESEEGKDTSTSSGGGQDGSPTLPGPEAAEKPAQDSAKPKASDEQTPVPKPPVPEKKKNPNRRRIQPRHALDHPAVIPSLATSTLMWTVGIGFAALTYWWLKKEKIKNKKKK